MNQGKVASSFAFKFFERFSVKAIGLVINILLARLLAPEVFGLLALMMVFVNLANTFVQSGFGVALVQNKTTKDEDYSTVFYVVFGVAVFFTTILFLIAPFIARYYNNDILTWPFRILSFSLLFGAFNSIQTAKLQREMRFKPMMYCNVIATVLSGIVGVISAYQGAGLWALVIYNLAHSVAVSFIMLFVAKWYPKFVFSPSRALVFFSFGWKMLVSGLLCSLYYDIRSLIIGRRYSTADLAYYNKGQQYPDLVEKTIDDSLQAVMLPVLSREQDSKEALQQGMLRAISITMFGVSPAMFGLAAIAKTMVPLLLTEKWNACIPLLMILCIGYMAGPRLSSNLSVLKATGRSDLYMKVEVIRRIAMVVILLVTLLVFDSVMAITISFSLGFWLDAYITIVSSKRIIGVGWWKQLEKIWKSFVAGGIMFLAVYSINSLAMHLFIKLILQIIVGVLAYLLVSLLLKNEVLMSGKDMLLRFLNKKKGSTEG